MSNVIMLELRHFLCIRYEPSAMVIIRDKLVESIVIIVMQIPIIIKIIAAERSAADWRFCHSDTATLVVGYSEGLAWRFFNPVYASRTCVNFKEVIFFYEWSPPNEKNSALQKDAITISYS